MCIHVSSYICFYLQGQAAADKEVAGGETERIQGGCTKASTLLVLIILPLLFNAQNLKQLKEFADQLTNEGNHYGASLYYQKAIEVDSTDIHLLYKYAHSLKNYNNKILFLKTLGRTYKIILL